MDADLVRAWRWHKQGLDGSLRGQSPARVLERSGWARSVGGCGPYLTLFARAGITREAADHAVAGLEIHELPAARACTYVVPSSAFALALKAGEANAGADMRVARSLGVTEKEIDDLCAAVVKALGGGSLDPDGIRERGCGRSLGPEGKKKGLTTTLPVALGLLQSRGAIRRVPVNGRLDQQRYRYTLWEPNPLDAFAMDAEEVNLELARRFFGWIGPATIAEFQAFGGLTVKASKAAVQSLGLVSLDDGGEQVLLPEDLAALRAFKPPREPQYALVSSLDGIALLRRNVRDLLDQADLKRPVAGEKKMLEAGGLTDAESHMILDRGRLIGFWEYDPESQTIEWSAFVPRNGELERAVSETEEFVRTQLGDARGFSLDSPKSRAPKIAALRALC
jgi:hypothetical protein